MLQNNGDLKRKWTWAVEWLNDELERVSYPPYRKNPKISDTRKLILITLKVEQDGVSKRMHPKDAEGIVNNVDPDQTAPLSENLGSLRYFLLDYHENPKNSDTKTIAVIIQKIPTIWIYLRVMRPKDADGMANIVDPDQTAPLGSRVYIVCPDLSVWKLKILW